MAIQQHGITRSTPTFLVPALSGQTDPDSLQHDLAQLREAIMRLDRHIDDTQQIIVKRLNEVLLSGTLAQRPAAGVADRLYAATDQAVGSRLTIDTGTAWIAP